MNEDTIRRIAIQAMFSDDELLDRLTLKGGNALRMVYDIGTRASIDLDFSIEEDFADTKDVQKRIFRLLRDRFDSEGFIAFDLRFDRRPSGLLPGDPWGGYYIEFKAISKELYNELGGDPEKTRKQAASVGDARQSRRFKIEISTYEYSKGRRPAKLDHYTIYVYTPEMIAAEKLRAICQQMPGYLHRAHRTARAKDFYDIHKIVTLANIQLSTSENLELCRNIFAAKKVPLGLLARIGEQRDFHRVNWQGVVDTVEEKLEDFDVYFEAVLEVVSGLEALWMEEPPGRIELRRS